MDTPRRVFGVACVMILIWIATFWLYEPRAVEPKVTFGETPPHLVLENPLPAPPEPAPPRDLLARPAPDPAPSAPEPAQTITRQRLEPPAFREYTVQRGDTSLEVIAQRELGDRRHWRAIAKANPFLNPDRLYPGRTVIRIPLDPDNIQGRVVEEQVATSSPPPEEPATAEPAGVEYTTTSGDTLTGIAKQFYGDPNLWRLIYEANRAVLRDPDRLPRGVKLTIPPKPARRTD